MLKEILASVRNIHFWLITASAAALLFAFSPRDFSRYVDARAELDVLRSLNKNTYLEGVANEALPIWRVKAQYVYPFLSRGQTELHLCDSYNFAGFYRTALETDWFTDSDTLAELDTFFDLKAGFFHIVSGLSAKPPDILAVLHALYIRHPVPPSASLCGISLSVAQIAPDVSLVEDVSTAGVSFFKHFPPTNRGQIDFEFEIPDKKQGNLIRVHYQHILSPITLVEPVFLFGTNLAYRWLRDVMIKHRMMSEHDTVVFLRMKVVWDEIADMTPKDAEQYLNTRIAATHGTIELFGWPVDERIATVVTPGVILLLEIYLFAALRLLTQAVAYSSIEKTEGIFWLALTNDHFYQALALCSLMFLPVGSILALLRTTHRWLEMDAIFIVITAVATLCCALGVFYLAHVGKLTLLGRMKSRVTSGI
jgi:hypothetical protein